MRHMVQISERTAVLVVGRATLVAGDLVFTRGVVLDAEPIIVAAFTAGSWLHFFEVFDPEWNAA